MPLIEPATNFKTSYQVDITQKSLRTSLTRARRTKYLTITMWTLVLYYREALTPQDNKIVNNLSFKAIHSQLAATDLHRSRTFQGANLPVSAIFRYA